MPWTRWGQKRLWRKSLTAKTWSRWNNVPKLYLALTSVALTSKGSDQTKNSFNILSGGVSVTVCTLQNCSKEGAANVSACWHERKRPLTLRTLQCIGRTLGIVVKGYTIVLPRPPTKVTPLRVCDLTWFVVERVIYVVASIFKIY